MINLAKDILRILIFDLILKRPLLFALLLLLLYNLFDEWVQYTIFLADSRIPAAYKVFRFSHWIFETLRGRKPSLQVERDRINLERELELLLRKVIAQKWKNYFFKMLKDCPELKSKTKKGS